MRLFVSVDLPEQFAEPIAAIQENLASAPGITLTDPTQAHVTLYFLGDVDPDEVDGIVTALERAVDSVDLDPFEARFGGLGVFPSLEYIRVVWLGVEQGETALVVLQEAVEDSLEPLGFEPDDHEFTPHVTLGRMNHAGGKAHVQSMVQERSPTVGTMTVDSISLTESVLLSEGAKHKTLESISLE
ncbi:RNA 2',3'-cyclic phosphodiesterase [Halobacteria archaeon AArc-curdl1]|uniref:RNA 2',3'-cyclic phosphodiesterase n=1 Tax=Natronosalvus hydrolyticus TaxID=2979988 RepID=A0AAP2Z8B0_9EURY|nr:RNA 2',3'-cyclic phosphodiesterase [Halobacteria archaeon AArc-curdl1]